MTLDELLILLSDTADKVLPILGCVIIIVGLVFLKKLITMIVTLNKTLEDVQGVVATTHKHLESLEGPLNTLNSLSETVDNVHEVSKNIVSSALVAVIENIANIKDWLMNLRSKKTKEEVVEEEVFQEPEEGVVNE